MTSKNNLVICGLALLFMVTVLGRGYADMGQGQQAPKFSLTSVEGKNSNLNDLLKEKKVVLINFWATWCRACQHEIPQLVELQKKFSEKSFTILGVDVGESDKKVAIYKDKFAINYPVWLDSGSETAKEYGVVGLPASFLIDTNGKILGEYHEYSDELAKDVEKALV
ncbi:MAG: TlpA family protein disulfide reductase [Candidatus Omnitrophica bacterium]|nr:TlpA family protein disulfide reductase [Candidatus Omnitrophota bacterium]